MTDLKKIPQKWFLLGLIILTVAGSSLGIYLFPSHFMDKGESKKSIPSAEQPVVKQQGNISTEKLNKLMDSLTLEEKVGQLFLFGFHSEKPPKEWLQFIQQKAIGGVFFNSLSLTSLDEIRKLTSTLNKTAQLPGLPYFFAVSQENGGQEAFPEGVTLFPSNMALAATKSERYAYDMGHITGRELKALGINLNLAPVLDMPTGKEKSFIGARAFADDPQTVALFGGRYLAGLQNSGIAGAVKYFPGMGESTNNPEYALPVISVKRDQLETREMLPFKQAIEQHVAGIVVGHGLYVQIDPRYPASLSEKFLKDILRNPQGMNYQGLIITDDLGKRAVADNPGIAPAAVQAVKAGADILLIRNGFQEQQKAYDAVLKAAQSGEIKESQLNAVVRRILSAKYKYALSYPTKQASLWEKVGSTPSRQKAKEIAAASITMVKQEEKALPLLSEEKMLLLTPDELPSSKNPAYLAELLEKHFSNLTYAQFTNYHDEEEKKAIKELVETHDTILVMTFNAGPNQASLLQDILQFKGKKVIVIAVGSPYDLRLFPDIANYLAAYSYSPVSLEIVAEILQGKRTAKGHLPVLLDVGEKKDAN